MEGVVMYLKYICNQKKEVHIIF